MRITLRFRNLIKGDLPRLFSLTYSKAITFRDDESDTYAFAPATTTEPRVNPPFSPQLPCWIFVGRKPNVDGSKGLEISMANVPSPFSLVEMYA